MTEEHNSQVIEHLLFSGLTTYADKMEKAIISGSVTQVKLSSIPLPLKLEKEKAEEERERRKRLGIQVDGDS